MEKETWYFFVFNVSDSTGANIGAKLRTTQSHDETGLAGWQVSNVSQDQPRGSSTWTTVQSRTFKVQVNGYTDTTPPAFRSAAVEFGTLTIAFNEALDPDSVPPASSFTVTSSDGTTITVSASPSRAAP